MNKKEKMNLYLREDDSLETRGNIFNNQGITNIKICGDYLITLPEEVMSLKNLRFIDLRENPNLNYASLFKILATSPIDIHIGKLSENNLRYWKHIRNRNHKNILRVVIDIPQYLPKEIGYILKLKGLGIDSKELSAIPDEIGYLTNLEVLRIGLENSFKGFPTQICSLTNLRELSLYGEILCNLPQEIENLENLEVLILNNCNKLPNTIGSFKNLKILLLSLNNLQSLPIELFDLSNLSVLLLDDNKLSEIPDSLYKLKNLTLLRVDNNDLNKLPIQLGELINLTKLYLSKNVLKSIPDLRKISNLLYVDLSHNQFITFPEGILYSCSLQTLTLNNNNIEKIPPEIQNLKNLENLNLSHNKIHCLPKEITYIENLGKLAINNNFLKTLPDELGLLTHLTNLDLANNQLIDLPESIKNLKKLQDLDLSNNQLIKLPQEIGNLKDLNILQLEGNKNIDFANICIIFSNYTHNEICITTKEEAFNKFNIIIPNLSNLPKEIGDLTNLTELDLSNSNLLSLPIELGKLKKLKKLILCGNNNLDITNLGLAFKNFERDIIITTQKETFYGLADNTLLIVIPEISKIPLSIGEIKRLVVLKFTNENLLLETVFEAIANFEKPIVITNNTHSPKNQNRLTVLIPKQNKLSPQIGNIKNLIGINLPSNDIKSLPPQIGNLKKLIFLNLERNKLASLPPLISSLINLTFLNLEENNLRLLPPQISNLENLTTLIMSKNQLESLPPQISSLANLKSLLLANNNFTDSEKSNIERLLPNCKILWKEPYSYNEISLFSNSNL